MPLNLRMELVVILPPSNGVLQPSHKWYLLTLIYIGHELRLILAHLHPQKLILLYGKTLIPIIYVYLSVVCTAARVNLDEDDAVRWEADRPKLHREWANGWDEYIFHGLTHQRPIQAHAFTVWSHRGRYQYPIASKLPYFEFAAILNFKKDVQDDDRLIHGPMYLDLAQRLGYMIAI